MEQMRAHAAHRTCLVLDVCQLYAHVPLTIMFSFVLFFFTTKTEFANIFEIKCNCLILILINRRSLRDRTGYFQIFLLKFEDFVKKGVKNNKHAWIKNCCFKSLKIKINTRQMREIKELSMSFN